jgi:hypothetical protein
MHAHLAITKQLASTRSDIIDFSTLGKIVRRGHHPDSPKLLAHYLELGRCYAADQSKSLQIKIYSSTLDILLDTLLDTICDHCVALQWGQ